MTATHPYASPAEDKQSEPIITDPMQMIRARMHFDDHPDKPAIEALLPAGAVGALLAATYHPLDKRHIMALVELGRRPNMYGVGVPDLKNIAVQLESAADLMRAARWNGKPSVRPYTSGFGMFPGWYTHGEGAGWLSSLTLAIERAAELHSPDSPQAERCERLTARAVSLVWLALPGTNVPPKREAELAAKGMTLAEYIIWSAARIVQDVGALYLEAPGKDGAHDRQVGHDARLLAAGAVEKIEAGVRYSFSESGFHFP